MQLTWQVLGYVPGTCRECRPPPTHISLHTLCLKDSIMAVGVGHVGATHHVGATTIQTQALAE